MDRFCGLHTPLSLPIVVYVWISGEFNPLTDNQICICVVVLFQERDGGGRGRGRGGRN